MIETKTSVTAKDLRIVQSLELFAGTIYYPGKPLPAEPDLQEIYKADLPTVRRATGTLITNGLLEIKPRIGTIVKFPNYTRNQASTAHEKPPTRDNFIFLVQDNNTDRKDEITEPLISLNTIAMV